MRSTRFPVATFTTGKLFSGTNEKHLGTARKRSYEKMGKDTRMGHEGIARGTKDRQKDQSMFSVRQSNTCNTTTAAEEEQGTSEEVTEFGTASTLPRLRE